MSQVWIKTIHVELRGRREMIPQPCSVAMWTHNNQCVCPIAMFPKLHLLSLHLSVYTTKVNWDIIGTQEIRLEHRKYNWSNKGAITRHMVGLKKNLGGVHGTPSSEGIYIYIYKAANWDDGSCGRLKMSWHLVGLLIGLNNRLTIL
jgi:hypothetical protein